MGLGAMHVPRVGSMNSMIWRGPSIEQGWVVGNTMSDGLGLKEFRAFV